MVGVNLFTPTTSRLTTKNPKRDLENENEVHLKHTHRDGRHYVQCIPCVTYPDVVKLHMPSQNRKLPPIALEGGTRHRKETVERAYTMHML